MGLKILFLVPELFNRKGGIQAFNSHLVNALLELGHALTVVSINDTENPGNTNYKFSLYGKYGHLRKPVFVLNTLKQLFSFKPDLILCGHVNFSLLAITANSIFKLPYFTLAYGVDVWNLNGLKLIGLKHSQWIITISKYTKRVILEQINSYPENKILLLPCTFDPEKFKPKTKPEYLMDKWKIKKDEKVLLTIARLSKIEKYKGYDKVIMTMKDIVKGIPNVKYIIVGSGDDMDRIERLIRNNGLKDKVIPTGFIPDEEIVDYYNLCDVFVMPSEKEGFGIVFLEALACGKPVIAGNKDGSVDALLDGELGILVDPDNTEGIAHAIIKVLKGEVDKRLLDSQYLRKRVIEVYGFDKFKERIKELIEKVTL